MIRRPRTVVVTGASVGAGRAMALAFAARGDRVALSARGSAGLVAAADEVRQAGGEALTITVDVADPKAVVRAAQQVVDALGRIDVWVNNAFAGVFAPFTGVTPDEYRRVTEVTYLGCVFGTRAALSQMLPNSRGMIVQVGSALACRGIPLHSAYCGAKHAIQGFSESLRCELLHDGTRVRTTMVQLPAVNAPQFDRVLSRVPEQARPVAPIDETELAARAIVHSAAHPRRRECWVGGSTVATLVANALVPGLLERYLARTGHHSQLDEGEDAGAGNLWSPTGTPRGRDFGVHGRPFDAEARPGSAQEWVSRNRGWAGKTALSVRGAAVAARKVTRGPGGFSPRAIARCLAAPGRGTR
jgi:NAD(P)-dependent dehydrogenase (short-subunit alcohol dehydrogenase family)